MGGNYSTLPSASPNFPYFTLTFRYPDKIKLCLANDDVIYTVRQAVDQHWNSGIQKEGMNEDGSYEIKFYGTPFKKAESMESAVQSKHVCCKMLADLHKLGWKLVVSSDLSRTTDFSTLFFHRYTMENRPQRVVCVSLSSTDSLQLINATESLVKVFNEAVTRGYALGVQNGKFYGRDYQVKLNGYPWHTSNLDENLYAREVLLEIIRQFDRHGFRFYGTANLKETADCMFFIEDSYSTESQSQFMMISLNRNDRMRLIDCPGPVVDATRRMIQSNWPYGLQDEKILNRAVEFKLKGTPWWANGTDTVWSRFLITMIFQKLLSLGWCLVTSLDVSRRVNDKSVLIFKSCQPTALRHFCISLNHVDKIRLINAPKDMPSIVRNVISGSWSQGIQSEKVYGDSYQFKLQGTPWESRVGGGNEYLAARCMMCIMLKTLMENGYQVVCSADLSAKYHSQDNGPDYPEDVHSWFVVYSGQNNLSQTLRTVIPGQLAHSASYASGLPSYEDLFGHR